MNHTRAQVPSLAYEDLFHPYDPDWPGVPWPDQTRERDGSELGIDR
jgi:hypothetical protein